jgi:hypothetical protein
MLAEKIFLLAGLLLLIGGAVVQNTGGDVDTLLFTGLMTMALGMAQRLVALPKPAKLASAVVDPASVVAFIIGGKKGDLAGAALLSLILVADGIGVARFRPAQSEANE